MATPCPLLNLTVAVPIDGGVKNMQSQPTGTWYFLYDYYMLINVIEIIGVFEPYNENHSIIQNSL